jgi:hypothetical protein
MDLYKTNSRHPCCILLHFISVTNRHLATCIGLCDRILKRQPDYIKHLDGKKSLMRSVVDTERCGAEIRKMEIKRY